MNRLLKIIALVPFVISSVGYAQNNSNSPYSYYGIGEFDLFNYSRASGMGGAAYGVKSGNFINTSNPASYSGIDSLRLLLDVSVNGNLSKFESTSENFTSFNGNFKRIALGFRMMKNWGVSLGFMPFTNVGYKVSSYESIAGLNTYSSTQYTGEGGLTKVYLGNSVRLFNQLSLGFNASMILGYINKTKASTNSELSETWYEKHRYEPSTSFTFDFGAQYSGKIKENLNFTVGLVGGLENTIKLVDYYSIYTSSTSSTEEKRNVEEFHTPIFFGGGFSINSPKWSIAADYNTQLWDDLTKINGSRFKNSHHAALGTEYCPDKYLGRTIFKRMTYQAGLHYDRTALTVLGKNYDIYGVSLGVVVPFKMQLSSLSLSVDMGTKGKKSSSLFRENYIKLNIGICFSDFWFFKRQYE